MNSPLSSKEIKAISKNDVHRICSGQVVLNLATAVKELVENSLDAGATTVDVLVRDYGSELVQVSDNGCGVLPENFQALTLKHHTSKLQDFSDLLSIDTFGFRGEALSSLCALSNLSIVTRHKTLSCATKLTFGGNGIITASVQTARQVGTTVMLNNIFSSLPVRQKEFQRNLKREFSKMCQLLTAYCLVSTGIKITCINETKKGSRTTVLATQGLKTVRENIACIYTSKQLSNLLPLFEVDLNSETLEELKMALEDSKIFKLEGFVSSCAHGAGRASADRQFYFINSRPCEPSKIMRTVNQVYHQFNASQCPFVFLNVLVARNCVDVNVTPDKRQIFLDNEKLLLAVIKETLMKLYENIPSTFKMNNIPSSLNSTVNVKLSSMWGLKETPSDDIHSESKVLRNNYDSTSELHTFNERPVDVEVVCEDDLEVSDSFSKVESFSTNVESSRVKDDLVSQSNTLKIKRTLADAENVGTETKQIKLNNSSQSDAPLKDSVNTKPYNRFKEKLAAFKSAKKGNSNMFLDKCTKGTENNDVCNRTNEENSRNVEQSINVEENAESHIDGQSMEVDENGSSKNCENIDVVMLLNERCDVVSTEIETSSDVHNESDDVNLNETVEFDSGVTVDSVTRKVLTIDYSAANLERSFNRWKSEMEAEQEAITKTFVRFRAVIDPSKNEIAEKELSREITKDMFEKMEVIGQFNLGFIIAKLNSDLFIVDQHATDEKYNFETLQKTTSLSNQKLVVPQKLELTAVNEGILIDNLEIFNANGFEFKIDDEANPTERISLIAIPMSKNWTFGKEDVDELLFMLQDSPHTLCRPSRVRAMFASRACRKSVMIGTALNASKMKALLVHMAEIEQPWNCPHGRPTMRHLVNLDLYR